MGHPAERSLESERVRRPDRVAGHRPLHGPPDGLEHTLVGRVADIPQQGPEQHRLCPQLAVLAALREAQVGRVDAQVAVRVLGGQDPFHPRACGVAVGVIAHGHGVPQPPVTPVALGLGVPPQELGGPLRVVRQRAQVLGGHARREPVGAEDVVLDDEIGCEPVEVADEPGRKVRPHLVCDPPADNHLALRERTEPTESARVQRRHEPAPAAEPSGRTDRAYSTRASTCSWGVAAGISQPAPAM